MSEDLHNIDYIFRDNLERYEEDVFPNVWKSIDQKLDQQYAARVTKKYKRLQWVAALVLWFGLSMAMYAVHTRNRTLRMEQAYHKSIPFSPGHDTLTAAGNAKSLKVVEPSPTASALEYKADIVGSDTNVAPQEKENPISKSGTAPLPNFTSPYNSKTNIAATTANGSDEVSQGTRKHGNIAAVKQRSAGSNIKHLGQPILMHNSGQAGLVSTGQQAYTPAVASLAIPVFPLKAVSTAMHDSELSVTPLDLSSYALSPLTHFTASKTSTATIQAIKMGTGKSRISFTLFYTPEFVYNKIQQDRRMFHEDDRNEIRQKEQNGFSSTFGALVNYGFNTRWTLQSGVTLSSIEKEIAAKNIYARPDNDGRIRYRINCSSGYSNLDLKSTGTPASGDSLNISDSRNVLKYVGIPLAFSYNIFNGRFSLAAGAGVSFNYITKEKIETTINNGAGKEQQVLNDIEGLKPSYVNTLLNVNASYRLNRNLALVFAPSARFAVTSINRNSPVKSYQNSLGLMAGLNLSL